MKLTLTIGACKNKIYVSEFQDTLCIEVLMHRTLNRRYPRDNESDFSMEIIELKIKNGSCQRPSSRMGGARSLSSERRRANGPMIVAILFLIRE
jgi:hypothetical protein